MKREDKIILYTTDSGNVTVSVRFEDENFWMTQKAIAELFDVQVPAIAKHLKNIYDEEELTREATVSKKEIVQFKRKISASSSAFGRTGTIFRNSIERWQNT